MKNGATIHVIHTVWDIMYGARNDSAEPGWGILSGIIIKVFV